jgi:uncharacterized protein YjbI with pentapeptide repeats
MTLPELTHFTGGMLRPDIDYDAVEFRGLDLSGQDAVGASFLECGMFGCRLDESVLRRCHMVDCEWDDVQATSLDIADSSWRGTRVSGCRIGALIATGAAMSAVTFTGGKLDYVNLRGSRLTDVTFHGCRLDELDVGNARMDRVAFVDCRIDVIEFHGAQLTGVDLSASELHRLGGVDSLAGAAISDTQLADLAATFAEHLGVRVVRPRDDEPARASEL